MKRRRAISASSDVNKETADDDGALRQLIFFRDGVSEGQFSQVINAEVQGIRVACQKINLKYKP